MRIEFNINTRNSAFSTRLIPAELQNDFEVNVNEAALKEQP